MSIAGDAVHLNSPKRGMGMNGGIHDAWCLADLLIDVANSAGLRFDQTPGYVTTVVREPVGVAALIPPWNAPVALATMKKYLPL